MGDKQKGRVAEPPKLVVTNKDKEDEKYGVDMVGDVAAEIRATFAKEPERFFLVGDDGIEYGYSMDKLHEKLPNGGTCKVRFGGVDIIKQNNEYRALLVRIHRKFPSLPLHQQITI